MATKWKNCKKGYPCGGGCITMSYICRKEFPEGVSASIGIPSKAIYEENAKGITIDDVQKGPLPKAGGAKPDVEEDTATKAIDEIKAKKASDETKEATKLKILASAEALDQKAKAEAEAKKAKAKAEEEAAAKKAKAEEEAKAEAEAPKKKPTKAEQKEAQSKLLDMYGDLEDFTTEEDLAKFKKAIEDDTASAPSFKAKMRDLLKMKEGELAEEKAAKAKEEAEKKAREEAAKEEAEALAKALAKKVKDEKKKAFEEKLEADKKARIKALEEKAKAREEATKKTKAETPDEISKLPPLKFLDRDVPDNLDGLMAELDYIKKNRVDLEIVNNYQTKLRQKYIMSKAAQLEREAKWAKAKEEARAKATTYDDIDDDGNLNPRAKKKRKLLRSINEEDGQEQDLEYRTPGSIKSKEQALAKKNLKPWQLEKIKRLKKDGMTDEEANAVALWISVDDYPIFNKDLRKTKGGNTQGETAAINLARGLKKAPSYSPEAMKELRDSKGHKRAEFRKDGILERGLTVDSDTARSILGKYKALEGKVSHEETVVAATALQSHGLTDTANVKFHITPKTDGTSRGKLVDKYKNYAFEGEVTYPPETKFFVSGVDEKTGTIFMDEL